MPYACKDRPPFEQSIKVQDGFLNNWARRMVDMEFRMSQGCIYSSSALGQADEKCQGCSWRAKEIEE